MQESIWDAGVSCPGLSVSGFGFSGCRRVRLPDRLFNLDQGDLGAARIGPDEIADQDEVRAGGGEFESFLARNRKADARRLEQFFPPLQALGDGLDGGALPVL